MRSKISVFLIVGFVVSLCALTTLAQEEEQKAQAFYIREVAVKPSGVQNLEAYIKELVTQETKYKFPYAVNAFSTEDFIFYFSIPLGEGTIEDFWKSWREFQVKVGAEEGKKIQKVMEGTIKYHKDGLIVLRPDLSYTPENPRLKPEEANFVYWTFLYIEPGKQEELERIAKKFVTFYKGVNAPDGNEIYEVIMGSEVPLYVNIERAKSDADYFGLDYSKILGDEEFNVFRKEAKALMDKIWPLVRKYEYKTGWFRPDLSYIPKEK